MALIDNVVAAWHLDEASGDALDAHGSNDLTETGGTIDATTGKLGGARDFESGDTEWFAIADNTDLSTGDIDFSFSCWVQFESLGNNRAILSKWLTTGNQREHALYLSGTAGNETIRWSVSRNGTNTAEVDSTVVPSLATWYHVVCWHDASANVIGIAINDATPVTLSHTTGVFDSSADFELGRWSFGYHDGLIDEVVFWKRVLTSGEITSLYNSGNGFAYPFPSQAVSHNLLLLDVGG